MHYGFPHVFLVFILLRHGKKSVGCSLFLVSFIATGDGLVFFCFLIGIVTALGSFTLLDGYYSSLFLFLSFFFYFFLYRQKGHFFSGSILSFFLCLFSSFTVSFFFSF